MKRRRVLQGAGAVTVIVAGGLVWRAYDTSVFTAGEGPAFEPWVTWRDDRTAGPIAVVRAGILAASAHNTQPWLFRVSGDRIDLHADTARNLGAFDPFLREMFISLGCALENMVLAARAQGFVPDVELGPGTLDPPPDAPPPLLVARVQMRPGQRGESDLYKAIPELHTNRGAYDADRPVAEELVALLAGLANQPDVKLDLYRDGPARERFDLATVRATGMIVADAEMVHDSEAWFRFTPAAVARHRDGVTLRSVGLPPFIRTAARLLPPPSSEESHRIWLETTRDVHLATARMTGFLSVHDLYDRPAALEVGRLWQRMHRWATAAGLAMQPLNQLPEMVDRERQLNLPPRTAAVLAGLTEGGPDWKPTFAFRMGHPTREAPPSPRRAVATVVMA